MCGSGIPSDYSPPSLLSLLLGTRRMLTIVENVWTPGFTSFMLNTYLIVLDSSLNSLRLFLKYQWDVLSIVNFNMIDLMQFP